MNEFEYEVTREALRAETPTAQRESATDGQAASTPRRIRLADTRGDLINEISYAEVILDAMNATPGLTLWGRIASIKSSHEQLVEALKEAHATLQDIIDECPTPKLPYGVKIVEIARNALAAHQARQHLAGKTFRE